jgi:hypothetical protein
MNRLGSLRLPPTRVCDEMHAAAVREVTHGAGRPRRTGTIAHSLCVQVHMANGVYRLQSSHGQG